MEIVVKFVRFFSQPFRQGMEIWNPKDETVKMLSTAVPPEYGRSSGDDDLASL
jgi:hypothetical protein